VAYATVPFTGPGAVLAYLSRHTHRVAISNRHLIAFEKTGITLRNKDHRRDGLERQRAMTLAPPLELIRRFLLNVPPHGFHRIRRFGLLAASARKDNMARTRELLAVAPPPEPVELPESLDWLPTLSLPRWPYDHHRNHAGYRMGGFRTSEGIRKPSPYRAFRRSVPFLQSGRTCARRQRAGSDGNRTVRVQDPEPVCSRIARRVAINI
jgi:hypothetical protein